MTESKSPVTASDRDQLPSGPREPGRRIDVKLENDGKLLRICLSGTLQSEDYSHFVPAVDASVLRHGKVRMIVIMRAFHGWSAGALWEDLKFDLRHFNHIERLAVVGETGWERMMATFCKPFTTARIRYFPNERVDAAEKWISEPG